METTTATEAAPATTETTETAPQAETQPTPTQVQAAKERLKLQVDGQEIEKEVDWNDKESLKKELQLAAAAKKRMGEAGSLKNQALQIIKAFESGDHSILAKHPKGREIAEAFLMAQIQEEGLTQAEKDQRAKDKELEEWRNKDKTAKEKEQQAAQAKRETELIQSFQKTIIDAIDKTGLPKSPELVKRMAGLLQKNLKLGLDLTADELAVEVKNETTGMLKAILGNATGAQLIEMFGPEIAKQIRKHDIETLKAKANLPPAGKKPEVVVNEQPKKGYMTPDEWKEEIARRVQS